MSDANQLLQSIGQALTCNHCDRFVRKPSDTSVGHCHAAPPQVLLGPVAANLVSARPTVNSTDVACLQHPLAAIFRETLHKAVEGSARAAKESLVALIRTGSAIHVVPEPQQEKTS